MPTSPEPTTHLPRVFRRYPKLILLIWFLIFSGLSIALASAVGGTGALWLLVCIPLGFASLWPIARIVIGFEVDQAEEVYERRLRPVREALETCWQMTGTERDYQQELLQHLFYTLEVISKPESPLPSGTRVDAYMEFGDEDWYITIKRGLKNQQRLTLQGEVEDIILHAPDNRRDLWICVIVGLSAEHNPTELGQFSQLADYAAHRSFVNGRTNFEQKGQPRVNIELMPVIMHSPPEETIEDEAPPA